ncbi:MAG: single-stranded DNA-binding protein [Planctomycetes bacterium]|nr:single-stranded DNA-binding protein [Planctomycetota bacterium]
MASYNKVILMGNLTRDPQLTYTSSNTAVCKFGLAMNHTWKDRNTGEKKEQVAFVDCVCFGRSGEVINQYMAKGRSLHVDGRLSFSQWEGQDGSKRSKLEVVVENFTFVGGGGDRQGGGGGAPRQQQPAAAQGGGGYDSNQGGYDSPQGGSPQGGYDGPPNDDSVPF